MSCTFLRSQNNSSDSIFEQTYEYINDMLKDEMPLSFKDAVMKSEVAFNNEVFDIEKVNQKYKILVQLANELSKSDLITYTEKDRDNIISSKVNTAEKYFTIRLEQPLPISTIMAQTNLISTIVRNWIKCMV